MVVTDNKIGITHFAIVTIILYSSHFDFLLYSAIKESRCVTSIEQNIELKETAL